MKPWTLSVRTSFTGTFIPTVQCLVATHDASLRRAVEQADIRAALGHTGHLGVEHLADEWTQEIRRRLLAPTAFQLARRAVNGMREVDEPLAGVGGDECEPHCVADVEPRRTAHDAPFDRRAQ
jgi:hypothetical protein